MKRISMYIMGILFCFLSLTAVVVNETTIFYHGYTSGISDITTATDLLTSKSRFKEDNKLQNDTFPTDYSKLSLKDIWKRHSLKSSYLKQNNKVAMIKETNELLKSSWATADIVIYSSRIK